MDTGKVVLVGSIALGGIGVLVALSSGRSSSTVPTVTSVGGASAQSILAANQNALAAQVEEAKIANASVQGLASEALGVWSTLAEQTVQAKYMMQETTANNDAAFKLAQLTSQTQIAQANAQANAATNIAQTAANAQVEATGLQSDATKFAAQQAKDASDAQAHASQQNAFWGGLFKGLTGIFGG